MTIAIKIAFLVYATIPVYIAADQSLPAGAPAARRAPSPPTCWSSSWSDSPTYDFRRLRTSADQLHPWFSFLQICLSIAIVADRQPDRRWQPGDLLRPLPPSHPHRLGDGRRDHDRHHLGSALAALAIVIYHKGAHHRRHPGVDPGRLRGGVGRGGHGHPLRRQAVPGRHPHRPDRVAPGHRGPAGGGVAEGPGPGHAAPGRDPRRRGGPGDGRSPGGPWTRWPPSPAGPGAKAGTPGPPEDPEELASGVRRAIDTRRVVDSGRATFVPNRTASGMDIVIVGIRRRAATLPRPTSPTR